MSDEPKKQTEIERLERELAQAKEQLAAKEDDADYYKWRLEEIIPLFQEARDALPAITVKGVKLRNISFSLADRMDVAGTREREEFDELRRIAQERRDNGT